MARKVFYSFHYEKDINRVMVVRNRWVTQGGQLASGIIDKAEFEKIKKSGDAEVKKWINKQLEGTTVTIVLLGEETLKREFVKYEICESIKRNNVIIGVHINRINDMITRNTSPQANVHEIIGYYKDGTPAYFDRICDGIYDYTTNNGYDNLGTWVESLAKLKGK